MARRLEIEEAIAGSTFLLFDNTFLIHEYLEHSFLLARIPAAQRRTSAVTLWEFLHGNAGQLLGLVERRERRDWLDENGIRVLDLSAGGSISFRTLLMREESPPGVADCLLAAECLARRAPLVTHDAGFDVVEALQLVFLPPP